MKNQKGNVGLVLIIVIVLAVLGFWYLMKYGPRQTAQGPVMTTSDLDAASKDMDTTDLNQMDNGISQLRADTSSF